MTAYVDSPAAQKKFRNLFCTTSQVILPMVSDFLVIAQSMCIFFRHNNFTKCLLPMFLLIVGAGESVSLEKMTTK